MRPSLKSTPCIWLDRADTNAYGPQTRLFRKSFTCAAKPTRALLSVFAESAYHLWINGYYVGRGPAFHHPHRRVASTIDVTRWCHAGTNVIAAIVYASDISQHNNVPTGIPGLIAKLMARSSAGDFVVQTDASWKASDRTGWRHDTPRRGWALAYIEDFDVRRAEHGWREVAFDDRYWPAASEQAPVVGYDIEWLDDVELPALRYEWQSAKELIGVYESDASSHSLLSKDDATDAYGRAVLNEGWQSLTRDNTKEAIQQSQCAGGSLAVSQDDAPALACRPAKPQAIAGAAWRNEHVVLAGSLTSAGGLRVSGLSPEHSVMVCFDLGAEFVGHFGFDADCESAGTIEIGWSEVLTPDGRPEVMRKNTSYIDRYHAAVGNNSWQPIAFNAGRYFCLIFRGFTGPVNIHRAGILASEPELSWTGDFHCNDATLNQIWQMCVRCVRVGTQEGVMDCPTREQAPYVGDGHPVSRWIGMLTGDWRHWRHLVREQFVRLSPDGLMRDAIFTGGQRSLVDYNLLGVIGARDYVRCTGDLDTARQVLDGCRRTFQWFDDRVNRDGLIDTAWETMRVEPKWEHRYRASHDAQPWATNVFIDHPGLGWHNVNEPGIDRRGVNAAINALYAIARRALADLEEACGDAASAEQHRQHAGEIAARSGKAFFNPSQWAFADGIFQGKHLAQISQQTNIWTLLAGMADPGTEESIAHRILCEDDAQIARAGPYFWTYFFPLLAKLNMHERALELTRRLWGRMLAGGATTLWETFAGDHLDTWCHPWSASPIDFLLSHILGLGDATDEGKHRTLKPRYDLLKIARGRMHARHGEISIEWHTRDGQIRLSGTLPRGALAKLLSPDGTLIADVRGKWQQAVGAASGKAVLAR